MEIQKKAKLLQRNNKENNAKQIKSYLQEFLIISLMSQFIIIRKRDKREKKGNQLTAKA